MQSICAINGMCTITDTPPNVLRRFCVSEDPSRAAAERAEDGSTERTMEELTAHGIEVGQGMNAETMKGYTQCPQHAAGLPYRTPVQLLNKLEFL